MRGDARVIEYLNRGVRHELTAINQYWLHYRLLDHWCYRVLAKQWRKESMEEMEHADKLIQRIIFLDGFPNLQVLDPLHIGQNVREVLDCDLAAEMSARALYEEAATHCHGVKDYVSRDLFEELMHDEEEHIDFSRLSWISSPSWGLSFMRSTTSASFTANNGPLYCTGTRALRMMSFDWTLWKVTCANGLRGMMVG
jgi:bacterioferritin